MNYKNAVCDTKSKKGFYELNFLLNWIVFNVTEIKTYIH